MYQLNVISTVLYKDLACVLTIEFLYLNVSTELKIIPSNQTLSRHDLTCLEHKVDNFYIPTISNNIFVYRNSG